MRVVVLAYGLGVAALAGMIAVADPATAAKTKLGCERGKEVWNASAGKCVPGKSKYTKAASKASKKAGKAAKMAPAKKKMAPAKN